MSRSSTLTPFPPERGWETESAYNLNIPRVGGFLDRVYEFDADFFNIRNRAEAAGMDPQHRLLLEETIVALDRAGIPYRSLRGTSTGVFVGMMPNEYGARATEISTERPDCAVTIGTSPSVASGRIAYFLGTHGPAVTIDTACSSSGVAVDAAVRALRAGDIDLAIVGGVSVLTDPSMFIDFANRGALSSQGRCCTFDDSADGTVWAEGVGVLVLERGEDAVANRRTRWAEVLGTSVSSDGASNGLTAPSAKAQAIAIRNAIADAGISPSMVDLIEAHGTATRIGDPIEIRALRDVFDDSRRTRELFLGSLKSNIGHSMAVSGIAGIIKSVMAIVHKTMPPTINVSTQSLNRLAEWNWPVSVLESDREWAPLSDSRVYCGVSTFGVSGTNAHVVLGSVNREIDFEREAIDRTPAAKPEGGDSDAIFLFPGQGGQWTGMGTELLALSSAFRAEVTAISNEFVGQFDIDVIKLITTTDLDADDRPEVVQPALFAMMAGIAAVWRSRGVLPTFVVGHSQGEVAAAYVAGMINLGDAVRIVGARASSVKSLPRGAMAIFGISSASIYECASFNSDMSVAAINSGASTTVASTDIEGLERLVDEVDGQGFFARMIPVNYASHSPCVEQVRDCLIEQIGHVESENLTPVATMVSSMYGNRAVRPGELDAEYWFRNLRQPVRFAESVEKVLSDAAVGSVIVEVSPHSVLRDVIDSISPADSLATRFIPSMRRGKPLGVLIAGMSQTIGSSERFAEFAPKLEDDDFSVLLATSIARRPFSSQVFDLHDGSWFRARQSLVSQVFNPSSHPWVSELATLSNGATLARGSVSTMGSPWLLDHCVDDTIVVPGTGLAELALAVSYAAGYRALAEFNVVHPVTLESDGVPVELEITIAPAPSKGAAAAIEVAIAGGERSDRKIVAIGTCGRGVEGVSDGRSRPRPDAGELDAQHDPRRVYSRLAQSGYRYGPSFQAMSTSNIESSGQVISSITLNGKSLANSGGFLCHPIVLDAAMHAAVDQIERATNESAILLPFQFTSFAVDPSRSIGVRQATCSVEIEADGLLLVTLSDLAGRVFASYGVQLLPSTRDSRFVRVQDIEIRDIGVESKEGRIYELTALRAEEKASIRHSTADDSHADSFVRVHELNVPSVAMSISEVASELSSVGATICAADTDGENDELGHAVLAVRVLDGGSEVAERDLLRVEINAALVVGYARSVLSELGSRAPIAVVNSSIDDGELHAELRSLFSSGRRECDLRLGARDSGICVFPDGGVLVPIQSNGIAGEQISSVIDADEVTIVLGARGMIAVEIQKKLIASGRTHHVVAVVRSRRSDDSALEQISASCKAHGVRFSIEEADCGDAEQVVRILERYEGELRRSGSVVSCVGALSDASVFGMTDKQIEVAIRAKVTVGRIVGEFILERDLATVRVFLCSSIFGVVGAPGQANYAAANVATDTVAIHLARLGLSFCSILWGLWDTESALTERMSSVHLSRLADRGIVPMSSASAIESFYDLWSARAVGAYAIGNFTSVLIAGNGVSGDGGVAGFESGVSGDDDGVALVAREAAAVLKMPASQVDVGVNFYELGLDSVGALELRRRLESVFDVKLPATVVFDHPSVLDLSSEIATRTSKSGDSSSEAPSVSIPCTPLQNAYLVGRQEHFTLGGIPTVLYFEAELPTQVDVTRLKSAVAETVRRHPMLNASFSYSIEEMCGEVLISPSREGNIDIPVNLVSSDGCDDDARQLLDTVRSRVRNRVFDLASPPLIAVEITEVSNSQHVIHFAIDVLCADGGSVSTILEDVVRDYLDVTTRTARMHSGDEGFAEFAVELSRLRDSDEYELARSHWRARAASIPPAPALPYTISTFGSLSNYDRFSSRTFRFSQERVETLASMCMRNGVSPTSAFLTAFAATMQRWSSEPDMTVNVLVSARSGKWAEPPLDRVVGNFSSTVLVVLPQVDYRSTIIDSIRAVQRSLIESMADAIVPGTEVLEMIAANTGNYSGALMPVVFNSTLPSAANLTDFSGSIGPMSTLAGLAPGGTPRYGAVQTPQVTLDHQVFLDGGDIVVNWDYVSEAFLSEDVDAMFNDYVRLACSMLGEDM